jgi:hypothetical protein
MFPDLFVLKKFKEEMDQQQRLGFFAGGSHGSSTSIQTPESIAEFEKTKKIVGGVIGGVLGLVLLSVAGYFLYRFIQRRRQERLLKTRP